MIDFNDYPKFKSDINTRNVQLEPIVVFGWIDERIFSRLTANQNVNVATPTTIETRLGSPYIPEFYDAFSYAYQVISSAIFAGNTDTTNIVGWEKPENVSPSIFLSTNKQKFETFAKFDTQAYVDYIQAQYPQDSIQDYIQSFINSDLFLEVQNRFNLTNQYTSKYFLDVDLDLGKFSEKVDFESKKYKINSVNIRCTNMIANGKRLSEIIGKTSYLNQKCAIFYKTPSCKTLQDCFPVFLGMIKSIKHNDRSISFTIEDYSDNYLETEVPIQTLPSAYTVGSNKSATIPMVYGNNDAVPVPYTQSEQISSYGSSRIKLYADSKEFAQAPTTQQYTYGNNFINQDPVLVLEDGKYYNVQKESYTAGNDNYVIGNNFVDFFVRDYDITAEDSYIEYQGNNNDDDLTLLEQLYETNEQISHTHGNALKLTIFEKPEKITGFIDSNNVLQPHEHINDVNLESVESNAVVTGTNEYGIEEKQPTDTFNPELGMDEIGNGGGLNEDSYIRMYGHFNPRSRGTAFGSSFQIKASFNPDSFPFSSELAEIPNNPSNVEILVKAFCRASTKVAFSINGNGGNKHIFDWSNNEGVNFYDASTTDGSDGIGIGPYYYPQSQRVGNMWFNTSRQTRHWDRTEEQLTNESNYHKSRGNGVAFFAEEDNTGGTDAEAISFPFSRWRIKSINSISGNDTVDAGLSSYQDIFIGWGNNPYADDLYFRGGTDLGVQPHMFHYFHWGEIKLYNIRLKKDIVINDIYNREYFIRVDKGRKDNFIIDYNTANGHQYGFAWIIRNLLRLELDVPEKRYDAESYDECFNFESNNFTLSNCAFSQLEPIKAKELIQKITKFAPFAAKFGFDGTFKYVPLKKQYVYEDVTSTITKLDVINFNYQKTHFKNLIKALKLHYHKDYGTKDYKATLSVDINDFNLTTENTTYSDTYYGDVPTTQIMTSDYIRSKILWDSKKLNSSIDTTNQNDGYATQYAEYHLLNNCQSKLTIDLNLPLKYLYLETGDIIKFDEVLGLDAFDYDYTKLQEINGMYCYPAFIVTKVSKSVKGVSCTVMQLWYLGKDGNHGWTEPNVSYQTFGCTNPNAVNFNPTATIDNGSCYFLGDVNRDGVINVIDIVETVNFILQNDDNNIYPNTPPKFKAMDINGDGKVDIIDIIALINLIVVDDVEETTQNEGILLNSVCGNPNALNYDTSGFNESFYQLTQEQVDAGLTTIQDVNDEDMCTFATESATSVVNNLGESLGSWGLYLASNNYLTPEYIDGEIQDIYAPAYTFGHQEIAKHYQYCNTPYARLLYYFNHNMPQTELNASFLASGYAPNELGEYQGCFGHLNIISNDLWNNYSSNLTFAEYLKYAITKTVHGVQINVIYDNNFPDYYIVTGQPYNHVANQPNNFRYNFNFDENYLEVNTFFNQLVNSGAFTGYIYDNISSNDMQAFLNFRADEIGYITSQGYSIENGYLDDSPLSHKFLNFTTCHNGQLMTDPYGNLDDLQQHFALYSRQFNEAFGYGPSDMIPTMVTQALPLAPKDFFYLQYLYGNNNNVPYYELIQSPQLILNPYTNSAPYLWPDEGYYSFEMTNITMTDYNDRLQVIGWLIDEPNPYGYDTNADSGFDFIPNGQNDVEDNGTAIFNVSYEAVEIYDEFGNSIDSVGTIPSIKFEIPAELKQQHILTKKIFVYAVIYHAANDGNRLGYSVNINKLTQAQYG